MSEVLRRGRRIEIETLAPPRAARKRPTDLFAKMPLDWAAAATKAIRMPSAMVLVLQHMAWKTRSRTFPLTNVMLARYGVNREAKRRVLTSLEVSGLVRIERRPNQAPIVTLVHDTRSDD
jgi:hypothetical protein